MCVRQMICHYECCKNILLVRSLIIYEIFSNTLAFMIASQDMSDAQSICCATNWVMGCKKLVNAFCKL